MQGWKLDNVSLHLHFWALTFLLGDLYLQLRFSKLSSGTGAAAGTDADALESGREDGGVPLLVVTEPRP